MGSVANLSLTIVHQANNTQVVAPLTDGVLKAWSQQCSLLSAEEKSKFESLACNGLDEYLRKLEEACQEHKDGSLRYRFLEWFQPLFKAVDLFTPAASLAVQAYPNPGSLVLGGIVAAVQATNRLLSYQKLTLQMLARMGTKAQIFTDYEKDIYKDDAPVQEALVEVYGDIILFCLKAVKFVTDKGEIRAKVKGLKLFVIRDFESQLGEEVRKFESHLEKLEDRASLCDKRRLKELRESNEMQVQQLGQMLTESRDQFQRQNELFATSLKDLREGEDRKKKEKKKERLLNWLSTSDSRGHYDQKCDEHLEGTGNWLLESEAYKTWKSSAESDLMWVKGRPGCGKSILAAVATTDLRLEMDPKTGLAYVFCRTEDEASENRAGILASITRQITQQQQDINTKLELEYAEYQQGTKPSRSTIRDILKSAISHFTITFIVIDGLDESKEHENLMTDLLELVQEMAAFVVKVIVFSRPIFSLEESLKPYRQLQPDLGHNEEDLGAYIGSLFPDEKEIDDNKDIRTECRAKADGMFLWVKLLAQNLHKQPLTKKLKLKRIKGFSGGLENMYDQILESIWAQEEDVRSIAFLVLIWITHAKRPLTGSEMLEAAADYSEASVRDEASKYTNPEHLVAICANLIYIDKHGCFRLCHETVRDHLNKTSTQISQALREYQCLKQDAHKKLAEICLTYLLLKDFECGPVKYPGRLRSLKKKFPFIEYAADCWGLHVSEVNGDLLDHLIVKLLHSSTQRELAMQLILSDIEGKSSNIWAVPESSNEMHILAIFGLQSIAERILCNVARLSLEADGEGMTPLSYALGAGHYTMSRWIIQLLNGSHELILSHEQKISAIHLCSGRGWADVLAQIIDGDFSLVNLRFGERKETPLIRACRSGSIETVDFLIKSDADVNLKDKEGNTPLLIAVQHGHEGMVKLLLEHEAEPNCCNKEGFSPLHYAAELGNAVLTVALLNKGALPWKMASDQDGFTPLHRAVEAKSLEVIRVLCRTEAKIDVKSAKGYVALHLAAYYNASQAVKLLLTFGNSINILGAHDQTAIFIAASEGALETVRVLIEARCDVFLTNSRGATALHVAAKYGKLAVVRYIVNSQPPDQRQKFINMQDKNGQTALHDAIEKGQLEVIKFLLESGADATIKGYLGSTPLHLTAETGQCLVARLLLEKTREANPRRSDGGTPLHYAARNGQIDFIKQFFMDCSELAISADIDALDDFSNTPLVLALRAQHAKVAEFLLEKGALSIRRKEGDFPIHIAAWYGYLSIVQALLCKDGVNEKGEGGQTAFFNAASCGHIDILKLLAAHLTIDWNERNTLQQTPLLAAVSRGHVEVTHYLLDNNADHGVVDNQGDGPLHYINHSSDAQLVKRLLTLGCRGDTKNVGGVTPLHCAVAVGDMVIIDAFLDAGFNQINLPTDMGDSCVMIAAEQGNFRLIDKLDSSGAQYGMTNAFGRTAGFSAAAAGHHEVLDFFRAKGENLCLPDSIGETPLHVAASEGYSDTVEYLLKRYPHTINCVATWSGNTPLLQATKSSSPRIIRRMISAGATLHNVDTAGYNVLSYAIGRPAALRELLIAGSLCVLPTYEERLPGLIQMVQNTCEQLLLLPKELHLSLYWQRIELLSLLSGSLAEIGDFDSARICLMDFLWSQYLNAPKIQIACEVCASVEHESLYLCKSCPKAVFLCTSCHIDYKNTPETLFEMLKTITNLEKRVQPVRQAVSDYFSVFSVVDAMRYFKLGSDWCTTVSTEYDTWHEKYNRNDEYRQLQRPGEEFLKITEQAHKLLFDENSEFSTENVQKLFDQYELHRRKYRADKQIVDFVCRGHEFLEISTAEHEQLKLSGTDLIESGRITNGFLKRTLAKYKSSAMAQRRHGPNKRSSSCGPPRLRSLFGVNQLDSKREITHRYGYSHQYLGQSHAPRTQRSSRRHSIGESTSTWIKEHKLSNLVASFDATVPSLGPQNRGISTLSAELKALPIQDTDISKWYGFTTTTDVSYGAEEMETTGVPVINTVQEKPIKTMNVSTTSEHVLLSEDPEQVLPADLADASAILDDSADSMECGTEVTCNPDFEIVISQRAETPSNVAQLGLEILETGTLLRLADEVTDDNNDGTKLEIQNEILRRVYKTYHGDNEDESNLELWKRSLLITEAMYPGFVAGYLENCEEQLDQSEGG